MKKKGVRTVFISSITRLKYDENNILIWIGVVLLAAAIALTVRRQFK